MVDYSDKNLFIKSGLVKEGLPTKQSFTQPKKGQPRLQATQVSSGENRRPLRWMFFPLGHARYSLPGVFRVPDYLIKLEE